MVIKLIKHNGMLKDFKIYKTKVDYEKLFNNLSEETLTDLQILTDHYHYYILLQLEKLTSVTVPVYCNRKINNIPTCLYLYITSNYKPFVNISTTITKIGITINLHRKDYISQDYYNTLQDVFIYGCDLENSDMFKEYIFNILFYAYIILKEFNFHPMLKYIQHEDDINELVEISTAHVRLYGELQECSACMEPTITKTTCNHIICQRCFCMLEKKTCPICRKVLNTEEDYFDEIRFLIE